ncbi:MAG: hypothetical protein ACHP65_08925 [Legionellales bacterium]
MNIKNNLMIIFNQADDKSQPKQSVIAQINALIRPKSDAFMDELKSKQDQDIQINQ